MLSISWLKSASLRIGSLGMKMPRKWLVTPRGRMASNSGCTEVLVDGAITPNFLRKPSESVMGGSLPQVAYGRQWRRLRLSLRTRRSGEHPPYRGRAAARTRPEREPLPATVRHARILTLDQERAMLRTGKEHLESLRDGRVVYI